MSFALAQLATLDEAKSLAAQINTVKFFKPGAQEPAAIGGGVAPLSDRSDVSGIYIPDWYTLGGPAPSETNEEGKTEFYYHFRFQNGVEGVNVGLVLDRLQRYPSAPLYVLKALFDEVESLAAFTGKRR